jgi:hypothetical protein
MSDDVHDSRYEQLVARYNAVVSERDRLVTALDGANAANARLEEALRMARAPTETPGLLCDGRCGRAIVGESEQAIRAHAVTLGWKGDSCPECNARSK